MSPKETKPLKRLLNNAEHLHQCATKVHALTNPLRLRMLSVIHEHGEINVKTLYAKMGIEQSLASQQLKYLRKAEVVETRRDGQYIYYSLNYPCIRSVANGLRHLD